MALSYCKINQDFPQLTLACRVPPIYLVPGFLSRDECESIVSETTARMPAAVGPAGASSVHAWGAADSGPSHAAPRTSSSVDSSDEWCRNIHELVSMLTQQSTEHMERPTVTRYLAGQEYVPHHDAFPPGDPLAGPLFGGNRICTVLVYLNDVPAGGHTVFHEARNQGSGVSFQPEAGTAVLFFPSDCDTGCFDPLAVHSAEQAVDEKWVTQTWVRQGSPGNMTTMAGRKAESAAAAATAAATESVASRPPEPEVSSGQGSWRYFPG